MRVLHDSITTSKFHKFIDETFEPKELSKIIFYTIKILLFFEEELSRIPLATIEHSIPSRTLVFGHLQNPTHATPLE